MRDELSTEVSYATVTQNTQGEPTEIVRWEVPDGVTITLREAEALIVDAEDTNGNDLPANARFGLGIRDPDSIVEVPEMIAEFNIRAFNALTLAQQQSGENAQRRRLSFDDRKVPSGQVTVEDSEEIVLFLLVDNVNVDANTFSLSYPARVDDE